MNNSWNHVRVLIVAVCITIVAIKGFFSLHCKHTFETVKETTSIQQYGDGWWEHDMKKYKERPITIHHLQCTKCGRMTQVTIK